MLPSAGTPSRFLKPPSPEADAEHRTQSVKCTFEKRGNTLRVWVEPLEHNDPNTEPPVVELSLQVSHIMYGRPVQALFAMESPGGRCTSPALSLRQIILTFCICRDHQIPDQACDRPPRAYSCETRHGVQAANVHGTVSS